MFGTLMVVFCLFILGYLFLNEQRKSYYWKSKGVPQLKHKPFLGLLWDYALSKGISLAHIFQNVYDQHPNDPYVGCFSGSSPNLIIKDPKLIQHVLRTAFNTFHSRGTRINWEVDILGDNVLFMEGIRWKLMRQRLTPVFTSGKLRNMFNIMNDSGKEFRNFIEEMSQNRQKHSLMNVITTFTSSSVGAAVFGINANPGTDFDSPLHKMSREANTPTTKANISFIFGSIFPKLFNFFNVKIFGDHEEFFVSLVKRVLQTRKESNIIRHDFIDNCLEIQKAKVLRDATTGYEMKTTDELMAGQAFFFFIAGVDPTATTINFALYELSKNKDILDRLHKIIDDVIFANQELTYDIVDKIDYVDKIINESLRMYPPIGNFQRRCVMDHVLPDGVKIDKDVIVTIPVLAVHKDPKYYSNPEVFDPERFTAEKVNARPNYTFLPFGEGDRICIGMRFAKLQIKLGLIHLLRNFTVRPIDRHRRPTYVKSFFSLRSDDLNYNIVPRH